MGSLGNTLQRLLNHLRALPSSLHPASASLQRAAIRLSRAFTALRDPQTGTNGVELLVRLRGRLQELEEAVVEAETARVELSNDETRWEDLRREAAHAREELERQVKEATTAAVQAATRSHSRTLSADLPRRVPSGSASTASTRAELDAFLSRAAASSTLGPPAADATAAARARALNEAFTLFLLSTSPSAVLPPDHSLSSIFRQSRGVPSPDSLPGGQPESLESRISTQLHQAYFDSFAAVFSPAAPASALSPSLTFEPSEEAKHSAWTRLAADISAAAAPLVPSRLRANDPSRFRSAREELEERLKAPCSTEDGPEAATGSFSPRKALEAVKATVELLQRLCSPARDGDVRALLSDIDSSLSPSSSSAETAANLVPLTRRVLTLAADMASDVQRLKRDMAAQWASEGDLREVVKEEAGERERAVVAEWVGGEEEVRRATKAWVGEKVAGTGVAEGLRKEDVAAALVETLFSDSAIALPSLSTSTPYSPHPPSASSPSTGNDTPPAATSPAPNLLPPPLLVPSPALFTLQNRFQALVILACLVTLAGPPPPGVDSQRADEEQDKFVRRVWAILEAEIPSSSAFMAPPARSGGDDEGTKIAHLADEVLSFRRALAALSPSPSTSSPSAALSDDEPSARLRSSVDRILRAQDPVYQLLTARLREGVRAAVVAAVLGGGGGAASSSSSSSAAAAVPATLRSGRRALGSSSTASSAARSAPSRAGTLFLPPLQVKGFDRPLFLREKVEQTVQEGLFGSTGAVEGGTEAGGMWSWMEEVWGGVLGWRAGVDGADRAA
ncbi:hypothetical protein JCM6882_009037 [Rhodosporidiobolus microsporus]